MRRLHLRHLLAGAILVLGLSGGGVLAPATAAADDHCSSQACAGVRPGQGQPIAPAPQPVITIAPTAAPTPGVPTPPATEPPASTSPPLPTPQPTTAATTPPAATSPSPVGAPTPLAPEPVLATPPTTVPSAQSTAPTPETADQVRIDIAAVAQAEAVRQAAAEEKARAQAALQDARAEQVAAQRALAEADTPAERTEATAALEQATAEAEQASAAVDQATEAVAEATAEATAVAEAVDDRRTSAGLPPLASAAPTAPGPLSGGPSDAGSVGERTAQAASSVADAVPGRSTTLLLALIGGVLALLMLIAREWTR